MSGVGRTPRHEDGRGFTLVELLIVVTVLPLIIGAIAVALLATFRVQTGITDRLASSGDTQMVSATFYRDVQSASEITTSPDTLPRCGAHPPIMSLQWLEPSGLFTVVSYSVVTDGSSFHQLLRSLCTDVGYSTTFTTPTGTAVISQNVQPTLAAHIVCSTGASDCATTASNGWIATALVQSISLDVNESLSTNTANNPGNIYTYQLTATPRSGNVGGPQENGQFPNISPLELLGSSSLLTACDSGATINVNGAMLFGSGSQGVSDRNHKTMINTSAVYYSGSTKPDQVAFVGPPPFTPLTTQYVDPFSNLQAPQEADLNPNPKLDQPGIYTTTISGGTLAPGIYYFTGSNAGIYVSNSTLSGTGVLLYFTNGASVQVGPNSQLNLSPMSSGPYEGLTIWQNKLDTQMLNWFGNASSSGLGGVVYAPGATVRINGTDTFFAADLIGHGLLCSGGGNGSVNIGYSEVPQTAVTLTFSSTLPTNATAGQTQSYVVSAVSSNTFGSVTDPPIYSVDSASTPGSCSIVFDPTTSVSRVFIGNTPGSCIIDANQVGYADAVNSFYAAIEVQHLITVAQ